ncbi:dynein axonemal assembly factor 11-like [Amphibalanus amphitrite]|uniref:dynein axonemal assembly factor 11-like n=1 Tax=Amphibalanus amphitrite TaxID=1232801 RepID=UPI001C9283D6|nr:dynein axonemal assembly factor 11-like [Amphibalanus amphitrite]XP_043200543.1 dynein axonemal assembly factor 11-like [Amphibalanus amphitrite]XP_043200545.1 dynein axonemal assembly factor 11-like [Amphibalanus amphitrite]XP_043200549.1 dynein axonemal assembly factor 11-like [Amphibalanus amphitrite]XP_043200555.1 dynein axonemal assembly factor 11-like [Amphibalanus amphitrite]XP_043200563.1 dynein axonemal assembly factor 11-like [Amphibalanus amphitrite]XP_043200572.1 dynein axonema
MVLITEELVRKRAEHNEKEIFSLEELSLHQCDVERIQHLDRWCRRLRILYLQSNLIEKIENVSRLKELEYLNLALNSIERVENLEGCESLTKLDLTLNFIGELTSVASLQHNEHLRELYLTGNPCADYEGYRDWVAVTLPQLQTLDGTRIEHSERITARQRFSAVQDEIIQQQKCYLEKRRKQKESDREAKPEVNVDEMTEEERKKFWSETTAYTPESRRELHRQVAASRAVPPPPERPPWEAPPRPIRLVTDDGRPLNVNPTGLKFELEDDEEQHRLVLRLDLYKHLDTSLLEVDVQPTHVTVLVRQRPFQLVLPEEVLTDSSTVQRSQVTGQLVVTMPKFAERPKRTPSRRPPAAPVSKPAPSAAPPAPAAPAAEDHHPEVPPLI